MKQIAMFQPSVAAGVLGRLEQVLGSRWVGQGSLVSEFEQAVELALGVPHAVAVNASSSAIRLALTICGVRPGDEVITTPLTCTLTNHPILEQFARVVFADIQESTGNINPSDIEHRITPFTKAILCTHWGGTPPDLDEINTIADRHGLAVIEDASEAFGARYHNQSVGAISRFTAFSFQAIQIINTGEGGVLAVRDAAGLRQARTLRWYGIDRDNRTSNDIGYYDFDITSVGFGYHMTNIAAAIGLENLKLLEEHLAHRRSIAKRYREGLHEVPGIRLLPEQKDREASCHFFTLHVERREDFYRKLKASGIETSVVHYRNDVYSVFGGLRRDLPALDRFSKSYIGLPTHPLVTVEDSDYIIDTIRAGW